MSLGLDGHALAIELALISCTMLSYFLSINDLQLMGNRWIPLSFLCGIDLCDIEAVNYKGIDSSSGSGN